MIKRFFLPAIFILLITCLIFFKIFTRGLYPIPGDLLVSFYFPWYSGSWEGYNPWTTHKELLNADSIRQIYIWKEFAVSQLKKGEFPLWNPYTFSGQPLAANFQSSAFYPLNFFYFLTDAKNAWILLIISQPFLGGLFMYLAIRSFKVSRLASLFGSTAFMFSSYLITWMENGNISHSYIWLPLIFYSINKYFEKNQFRFPVVIIFSLALSILAGHPQTAIYLFMAAFLFWIFKSYEKKDEFKKNLLFILALFVLAVSLSAIQIFPTASFYRESPISLPFSKEVFDRSIMPLQNLLTFFASDFFGHAATNNFWSRTYGDFTPHFGVIPLIFSLWAIKRFWQEKFVKFASIISALFILGAVNGPITYLIKTFQVPLLDSTTPSRFISISIFMLIILSAMGFEDFIRNCKSKKYLKVFSYFLCFILSIYFLLWLYALLGSYFLQPKESWQINLSVTRRNLILPTSTALMIFLLSRILILVKKVRELGSKIPIFTVFFLTVFAGVYYSNKFLPVAPKSFIFPNHPIFDWLKNNAGINRFHGSGTAHIDFNYPAQYQIYGAEGYDTLRLQRYAELLASGFNGKVPKSYLRSDGVFANEENGYRRRLFELLGIKYLLDKEDSPKNEADWHYERFQGDKVRGIWQQDKFQVLERENVLPRVFLTTQYEVINNDEKIVDAIYNSNFNLRTLILEKEPPIQISKTQSDIQIPKITKYEPNEAVFETGNDENSLLFLSDAYSKDIEAKIDGVSAPVLRTHYALRSVAVPAGNHQVSFIYNPRSFYLGLKISIAAFIILLMITAFTMKAKKF